MRLWNKPLVTLLTVAASFIACGDDGGPTGTVADTVEADTAEAADTAAASDTAEAADTSEAADTVVAADTTPTWPSTPPETIGGDRPATVVVPSDYDGAEALPAVFLLGGYWYYAWELDEWVDASGQVDALGFVLVLPDGTIDDDGAPFWNATDTCCDYYGSGVDDVGYLTGLLDELAAEVHVDPARVYFVGHSNGGFMSYRMACEVPERVAGVVSIAGSGYLSETACGATEPVSVLQVHGLDDDVMPFIGDSEAPGALEMMQRWGGRAGCDTTSWSAEAGKLELVDEGVADETTVSSFAKGCDANWDVRLWALTGSDHYPEFRAGFIRAALEWAFAHPRPAE